MNKNFRKYFIVILTAVLLNLFNTKVYTQAVDSVDVSQIVQNQIEEAKKKSSTVVLHNSRSSIVEVPVKGVIIKTKEILGIPEDYFYKGLVLVVGAFAIGIWYLIRQQKYHRAIRNNSFKTNIKMMREEKFIKEIDPRLRQIRTNLTLTSAILKEDQQVTAAAKKSRIGKEEILLASRIRSHELQFGNKRSFA